MATSNHTPLPPISVSSPVLQVEALKIAFQVIDLLLLNKKDKVRSVLLTINVNFDPCRAPPPWNRPWLRNQ